MGLPGKLLLTWHLLIYTPSAFALPLQPNFANIYATPPSPRQGKKCPGCAAQLDPSVCGEEEEGNLSSRGLFSVYAFEINLSVVNICQYVRCSRPGEKGLLITQCNSQFWQQYDFK